MRLGWPFRRVQRSPSSEGDAASERAAASARSAARDDWRRLPPLTETIGPPPLVAPHRPFAGALAASNPPPPILAPLAHDRSLEAPPGLVVGVARPVVALGGEALPRPAQRSPLGIAARSADPAREGEPTTAAATASDEPAMRPASAAPAIGSPAASAPRRLEIATTAPPIRGAMTQAPEPNRLALAVGLVGQPRPPGRSSAPLGTPAAQAVQRAPITPSPPPSASSDAASTSGDPLPVAPRLTLGQARRLGLGAPITGVPLGGTPLPSVGPIAVSTGPSTIAETAHSDPFARSAGEEPGAADGAGLPLATARPTAASSAERPAPSSSPAPSRVPPTPGPAPSAGTGPRSSTPIARAASPVATRPSARSSPIVSARSLRAGVQRAPLTLSLPSTDRADAGSAIGQTGPAPSSPPVRIHRGADASDLAEALDARSFTHGGEIFMPPSVGSLDSGKGKALLAHEMTHVAQQRRLAGGPPGEDSPQGRTLEAEAVAAERAPDLALATRSTSRPGTDAKPDAGTSMSLPAASSGPTAPHALPQRAPRGAGEAGVQRAGRGSKSHTHTEQELEVLAHQLYHRIGRHLRRELLVDRERAGLALDLP